MTATAAQREETQVFQVQIKATPEAIWTAITSPDWTERYGYGGRAEFDLKPGGRYRAFASEAMKAHGGPDVVVDGEVLESDPPKKLVQTWRALWSPDLIAEGARRLTWEIAPGANGMTTLTVTHELANAPQTRAQVSGTIKEAGGGWTFVLNDLKLLLETGKATSSTM
jgi:uncharacterized protein YndB with AHSA1/START domain